MYCGDLDRYVELTGEVAERYGSERGYGLAVVRRRPPVGGRIEEALALTEESVAAARALGNPYWISYALWIAGMAFSQGRRAPGARGVGRGRRRSCASTASSSSRASSRATRPACTPPTASPRPRSVLFADAIAAFQRAGNVPQLIITLASVPALFERLDRLAPAAMLLGALSREPSSFHHVPELAELGDRVSRDARARRAPPS